MRLQACTYTQPESEMVLRKTQEQIGVSGPDANVQVSITCSLKHTSKCDQVHPSPSSLP